MRGDSARLLIGLFLAAGAFGALLAGIDWVADHAQWRQQRMAGVCRVVCR